MLRALDLYYPGSAVTISAQESQHCFRETQYRRAYTFTYKFRLKSYLLSIKGAECDILSLEYLLNMHVYFVLFTSLSIYLYYP